MPRPHLAEPASAITDAVLGAVAICAAEALRRRGRADPVLGASVGTVGGAALWGAVHHAALTSRPGASRASWGAIATTLSAGLGLLLVGSARVTLGGGPARSAILVAAAGPVVYVLLARRGRTGIGAMVLAQGPSMAGIVGLWLAAAARRLPGARLVLLAMAASGAAAGARAIPEPSLARVGLDPDAAYHLAQVPGILALAVAAEAAGRGRDG